MSGLVVNGDHSSQFVDRDEAPELDARSFDDTTTGIAHILRDKIVVTDAFGKTDIVSISGTKSARTKDIAEMISARCADAGIGNLEVRVSNRAVDAGNEIMVREISKVMNVLLSRSPDHTPIPHDGCRPPKVRHC